MRARTEASGSAARSTPLVQGTTLRQALGWVVQAKIFDQLSLHGNTKWQPAQLVTLAILWVWSDQAPLTAAFTEAAGWAAALFGERAVRSYQGLTAALARWTGQLLPLLWSRLHQCQEECGQAHWRVGRWLALAVDGSRVSTPRTQANERAFCAPSYGQGKTAKYRREKRPGPRRRPRRPEPVKPQIWTTLLWHMGLGLPWSWRNGPSTASERDHFRQMLREQTFPADTLFCADAGFVGYDLWADILTAGHSFLIRVGGNVTLLRQLGYVREFDGVAYCWPNQAAKRQPPPLVLRLWRVQVGRCPMALVTNVLDEADLPPEQVQELYRLRWGIELQFRTLKQTFGRRKLRSKTPERALAEMDWSLLGLTVLQLFAVSEQVAAGQPPRQGSVALAWRLVRALLAVASPTEPGAGFGVRLRAATIDRYRRTKSKKARYRPAYKDKPAAGEPKIIVAQQTHKELLAQYRAQAA